MRTKQGEGAAGSVASTGNIIRTVLTDGEEVSAAARTTNWETVLVHEREVLLLLDLAERYP